MHTDCSDVVVIGGGLGGLAAATYLARAGLDVTVFERSRSLGGRAATHVREGFHFNLGPHALYRRGEGAQVLHELGIRFSAGTPNASGGYAVHAGTKHALPGGFVSLLTTGLFGLSAKLETARLLSTLPKLDARAARHQSVRVWLDERVHHPDVRRLVQALFRLSTYANDPDHQSAGAAIEQLQMALAGNVYYLDRGWQTLVDGIRDAAATAGARIVSGTRAATVAHEDAVQGVRLPDGALHRSRAVVIAATPPDVATVLPDHPGARRWAEELIPVRAACLDIALERLPQPHARFALGIDRPLYLSVHSAVAQLAPNGKATICVAKYLSAEAGDGKADEGELEDLLDLVQPGWRALVHERRFLPNMMVNGALPTAAMGGIAGRPACDALGVDGLWVVGDWVGSAGQLADATLASARYAAQQIVERFAGRAAAA
jgi:phytoene dehydrogenase-like protein